MSGSYDRYRNPADFLDAWMSYLQGTARQTPLPEPVTAGTAFVTGTRYEFEVCGIGRDDKQAPAPPSDPPGIVAAIRGSSHWCIYLRVAVSYRISSIGAAGLSLSIGTWSYEVG
jgi:hypothetical protein